MRAFYFGVWSPTNLGHHLFQKSGRRVDENTFPFKWHFLDHFPKNGNQSEAMMIHISALNKAYTIISMSDYSGDKRGGSNAAFIIDGHHTFDFTLSIFADAFPEQYRRINTAGKIILKTVKED